MKIRAKRETTESDASMRRRDFSRIWRDAKAYPW
jgi:hypothetical protein